MLSVSGMGACQHNAHLSNCIFDGRSCSANVVFALSASAIRVMEK
jgi:hypothetical protein